MSGHALKYTHKRVFFTKEGYTLYIFTHKSMMS